MKSGKSLVELAKSLEEIRINSKDLLVPAARLSMDAANDLVFENGSKHAYTPSAYAHGQIAGYAGVPKQYYDKLRSENPQLLANNVNHGIARAAEEGGKGGKPETRMIRTVGDKVRAVLSSSYRRLDSYDMCQTVLPLMADRGMQVVSSEITDSRLYIKALSPRITTEVKKGDVVQFGLVVSNSDVGAGSVRVEPLIFRLVCQNGLIMNTAIRKTHVGKNLAGDDIQELLTRETLDLTDKAFWAQVHDIVLASMDPQRFEAQVETLRHAAERKITNYDIPEVVELTARHVGISGEKNKENMIAYLANGADGAGLTQWGLVNAVTFAAQQEDVSYDDSVHMERTASKILELTPNQWRRIAEVA